MAIASIIVNKLKNTQPKGFVKPGTIKPSSQTDQDIHTTYELSQMALVLDATLLEAGEFRSEPTVSPVEDGSNISDHVTLKPIGLTIEGIVSDTPVSFNAFKTLGYLTRPSQDAHDFLYNLNVQRQVFDYVSGLMVFKNMILTEYKPTRTPKTGSILHFSAKMQQVVIVASQTLSKSIKSTKARQAGKKVSKGTQSTKAPSPVQAFNFQAWDAGIPHGVEPTAGTL